MKKTSAHLKPCNIQYSESHNKREKDLKYIRKELTHLNESYSYIPHSLRVELSRIKKLVKEQTGRKLQKNAEPLQECVVVIKDDTTMDELKDYCEQCRQRFGIIPLQIHMHKDEGHKRSKVFKPNLHAHIVWSVYGEDGRNVRIQREDCRQMQTMAAECLGMERGVPSGKKHLDALEYKIQQQEEYLEELESNVTKAIASVQGALEGAKQGISDLFTGKARKRAEEAEERAEKAEKLREATVAYANERIAEAKDAIVSAQASEKKVNDWKTGMESQLANLKQLQDNMSKTSINFQETKAELSKVRREQEQFETNLPDVIHEGLPFGVSVENCIELAKGNKVEVPGLRHPESTDVLTSEKRPIILKWDFKLKSIVSNFFGRLLSIAEFFRQAKSNPWYSLNGVKNGKKNGLGIG